MTGFKTHRNSEQILCQSFPDPSLDKTSAQIGTFPVLIENYDRKTDRPTNQPTDLPTNGRTGGVKGKLHFQ